MSPSQGKSLIIPANATQVKQISTEQRNTPTKQLTQAVSQQLLQTITAPQKQQILVQKQSPEITETIQTEKIKVS